MGPYSLNSNGKGRFLKKGLDPFDRSEFESVQINCYTRTLVFHSSRGISSNSIANDYFELSQYYYLLGIGT